MAAAGPAGDWHRTAEVDYRLISATRATGALETIRMGIEFDLKPGWHIYWRSPGDAGFPPELRLRDGTNAGAVSFRWPRPERFLLLDIETIGYSDRIILPLDVKPVLPGQPLQFDADLSFLICKEICIPVSNQLSLSLPGGQPVPSEFAHEIDRFDGLVPPAGGWPGLELAGLALSAPAKPGEPATLDVRITNEIALVEPDLLVEATPDFWFGRPVVRQIGNETLFSVPATGPAGDIAALTGQMLTLTVMQEGAAAELTATAPNSIGQPMTGVTGEQGIATFLLLAFLGGLILNLMPCVLPVLSMKLVSIAGYGGAERRVIRQGFLASAAGIITTIMVLAGGAILLKLGGAAVGWGIQFQQPLFLVFMTFVVVLFALNLFGRFELALPSWLGRAAAQDTGSGLGGHFMTGVFATLLATPCSAPFLGSAVGFALAGSPTDIALIFLLVGLGLAAPYLAVAMVPELAAVLPRPGPWMIRLKQVLGIALLLTAVWLLSVLMAQIGGPGTGLVAGLLAVMSVAIAFRPAATVMVSASGLVAVLLVAGLTDDAGPAGTAQTDPAASYQWVPFDRTSLAGHIAAGRTVLVDVTADWCVTCQVNKKLVLDRGDVATLLSSGQVVAMRADWTRPSDDIAAYLAGFGRYGIPFNVIYGPGMPDGYVLPELLTADRVLTGFGVASDGRIRQAGQ
ncbi:MAG: protein-disulfide reductase DsbD family protein [Rhodospirillales bacterium]